MTEAAEVADDFKADLKDLTTNDRYAISNFTVIAKESVQHADAISNVILDHVIEVNRNHKLPALYVLDSIVKNIGNPFTLFISPRLYNVFMEAYCVVDAATRRRLDDMLKTWKLPVPGSSDPKPVFPPDITKRIENALTQWKAKTAQQEQEQQRAQQNLLRPRTAGTAAAMQWRNTPTPPQNDPRYPVPVSQGYVQYQQPYATAGHMPPGSVPQPFAQPIASNQGTLNLHDYSPELASLHQDTEALIERTKAEFSRNVYDDGIRARLQALLDLQSLLRSQQLPPDQLHAVRAELSKLQLSSGQQAPQHNAPAYPDPSSFSNQFSPPPYSHQQPNTPQFPLPQPPQPQANQPYQGSSQALPSTDFLSGLLTSAGRNKAPQPPAPPPNAHNVSDSSNPLLAQLRAAGLLGGTPSASQNTTPLPNIGQQPAPPNGMGQNPLKSVDLSQLLRNTRADSANDVQLTSASLKIPRPHLINRLYDSQPNQCLTCGKRFLGTEDGKAKKAKHLDWHFKTNQRLVEAAQRGQSRSWYVDEKEWIKYRDTAEGNEIGANELDPSASSAEAGGKVDPKSRTIPVPSDNNMRNAPCPICQEKFEQSWDEGRQDFVFVDAVKVGGRIYHASCWTDYRKDEGNTPARNSTPDSVLGKRKAEASGTGPSPAKRGREGDE